MFVEGTLDNLIENAIRDGCREAVKQRLTNSYNNPLDKMIDEAISRNSDGIKRLIASCIEACIADDSFRASIAAEVQSLLAKTLVKRFGGELERQVNTLKSDPATRARITLAIEKIAATK